MKTTWNVLSKHSLMAKSALYLAVLVALLTGIFSMTTVASAHSIAQPTKFAVTTSTTQHGNVVHPHGTNGQQLALWIGSSTGLASAVVSGSNQNGTQTAICFVGPNGTPIPTDQWGYYNGYWWLGTVSISYYAGASCTGRDAYNTSVFVTGFQPFSDYTCFSVKTSQDPNPSGC